MRFLLSSTCLLLIGAAASFAQVRTPRAGVARFADGSIREIQGIPGNYITGSRVLSVGQSVAFASAGGLVAANDTLQLLDSNLKELGRVNIDGSTPLLNIDTDLTSSIAFLPGQNTLVYWNGKGFSHTELRDPVSGIVTWVSRSDEKQAEILTFDVNGNTFSYLISLESGNVASVRSLPGVTGPAYRLGSAVVTHTLEGLRIYLAGGTTVNIPLGVNDLTVEHMSSSSLHLSSSSGKGDWVVYLDAKGVELWELPAPIDTRTHVGDAPSGETGK